MSVEQAKAFAEKALKDQAILKKLNTEGADVVAIAKEHGHEFDEQHVEAGQAHLESLVDEMSDDELDDVAGGRAPKKKLKSMLKNKTSFPL